MKNSLVLALMSVVMVTLSACSPDADMPTSETTTIAAVSGESAATTVTEATTTTEVTTVPEPLSEYEKLFNDYLNYFEENKDEYLDEQTGNIEFHFFSPIARMNLK